MNKHAGKPTCRRMRAEKKTSPLPPFFILSVFWIKEEKGKTRKLHVLQFVDN